MKFFGVLSGILLGFAAFCFILGFLALRGQSRVLDFPMVFIDYWSYAETGVFGLVQSLKIVLENWPLFALVIVLSICLILGLESSRFRKHILDNPLLLLIISLIFLLAPTLFLIQQQIAVRDMADINDLPRTNIFKVFAEQRKQDQAFNLKDIPADSFEGYRLIANELEAKGDATVRFQVRPPNPGYLEVEQAYGMDRQLLYQPVPKDQTPQARATKLFSSLVLFYIILLWLFVLCLSWARLLESS